MARKIVTIPTPNAKALYRARCKRLGIRVTKLGMKLYVQTLRRVEKRAADAVERMTDAEFDQALAQLNET